MDKQERSTRPQQQSMGVKDGTEGYVFLRVEKTSGQVGVGVGPVSAKVWAENAIPANHGSVLQSTGLEFELYYHFL